MTGPQAERSTRGGRHPRGQALIIIVFIIIALVGVTGLAVDGGNAYVDRRKAQTAADSAALAGALARLQGAAWIDRMYQVAAENGYDNNGTSNSIQIYSPPISGTYQGDIEYIQIRITSHLRTYFAPVLGIQTTTNTVEAVARSKPSVLAPMFNGNAVVSLAPSSDCLINRSFYVTAEATLDISGGGIFVNSNNPTCALIQQAEGSLRLDGYNQIHVVGGYDVAKPKLLTPFPPVKGDVMPYPPPIFMPKVGCGQKEATVSEDGQSISSGNWGADPFPPPGVTHLESGNYCLEGDFIMNDNSSLEGGNVLIYMRKGQLRLKGSNVVNLSGRAAGEWKGLLIYQPIENKNPMILNAEAGSGLKGTILAPGSDTRIKGNDSKFGFHSQIVGYTIYVDGDSNVVINYIDDQNYWALTMPVVQLAK